MSRIETTGAKAALNAMGGDSALREDLDAVRADLAKLRADMREVAKDAASIAKNSMYEAKEKVGHVVDAAKEKTYLMDGTEIAIVFLDATLRIRNFTPAMQELFPLLGPHLPS